MTRGLNLKKILLFLGDLSLLYLALFLTLLLGFWKEFDRNVFIEHLLPFSILYSSWLIVFYIFGFYDLSLIRRKINLYSKASGALLICLIIGVIFFYSFSAFRLTPKTNLLLNIVLFGIFTISWREIFYYFFSSYFLNKTAILGTNNQILTLSQEIFNRPYLGYKIVNFNSNQSILTQIKENDIDTLIVADDLKSDPKIANELYQSLQIKINFMDFSKAYELICQKIPLNSIDLTWFLENLREGEKGFYDRLKRGFDIIFATIIFLIFSPLFPLVALAIKIEDGGPILYKQERIGKNRRKFLLFKFRSMKKDAENGHAIWAKENDKRITNIGMILRMTHLDELPQMINVLKGEISLIGPRPERPEFVSQLEKEIPHYHLRHIIKPGFSGWAQIKFRYGRSVIDSREKFQYDLFYLKNRSFLLDISILLRTFQLLFKKG
ncbi:MAG: sugar transferase [Candidatus Parcubacteria bacterium]|nr:sugar transferase [Candidatus Parcubacteria bacterium]